MDREQLLDCLLNEDSKYSNIKIDDFIIKERLKLIPNKLYRYRPGENYDLDALIEDYIWFSHPKDCDDLIDFTIKFEKEKIIEQLRNYIMDNKKIFYQNVISFVFEQFDKNINEIDENLLVYLIDNTFLKEGNELDREILLKYLDIDVVNEIEKVYHYIDDLFKKIIIDQKVFENILDEIKKINTIARNTTMICCFSDSFNNSMLWSKYAREYSGFCVEYDLTKIVNFPIKCYDKILGLYPIIYKEKEFVDLSDLFIHILLTSIFKNKKKKELCNSKFADIKKQLLTKEISWHSQNEWRICIKNTDNKQLFPFVSAIYIGRNTSDDLKEKLIKIAIEKSIDIYQQKIDNTHSEFIFEKLLFDKDI